MRQHEGGDQRAGDGAGLVERLLQAERPALADVIAGFRLHRVGGRAADRLARTFEHDEERGGLPIEGEGHRGHREHGQGIAADGQRPIGAGGLRDASRDEADGIAGEFAAARDDPDRRAAGAERGEVFAVQSAHAFIGHVGEQADDAEGDDEGEGAAPVELFHAGDDARATPTRSSAVMSASPASDLSCPRRRASSDWAISGVWIPAFAGMTVWKHWLKPK
ncbi:MAG: hypothetical protein WDM81_00520 [Rhizomicrobium sp.]